MIDHLQQILPDALTDSGVLKGVEIPPDLQANVDRHYANLVGLIKTLGNAGIDEATIEASVAQIIASYQAELLLNIKKLYGKSSDV